MNFTLIEQLKNDIYCNEQKAQNKLGVNDLKEIDFYNIKGLRKLDCFIIFENTNDKFKVLKAFEKVY